MKIWNNAAILLIGAAIFMSGCTSKPEKNITESTSAGLTEATESATETGTHPVSKIAFMRRLIEENNASDEAMEQQGFHALKTICFISFTQDKDPYEPIENIKVDKNSMKATVVVRIEEGESDGHSEFQTYAVMMLNGKIVDFSLDGNAGKDGILSTTMQSNTDYIFTVSADDLPVIKGDNELTLTIFGYSESRDLYIDRQYSVVHFTSDHDESGKVIEACPEDKINIITHQDRNKAGSVSGLVSPEEQLDFESDHYGYRKYTVKPSAAMHFFIDNMSIECNIGNRRGLMLFFVDGKLQPVWNGSYIAEISLKESDLKKEIIIDSRFKPGEEHNICWHYVETRGVSEWPVSDCFTSHLAISDK